MVQIYPPQPFMPITYGDPTQQRRYNAFKVIDESGHEPLSKAIQCALELRSLCEKLAKDSKSLKSLTARQIATQTLLAALSDQFHAWKQVAEFVYAKPKQPIEVSGTVTLEQVLAASIGHLPEPNG